jgi:hypothetical protein
MRETTARKFVRVLLPIAIAVAPACGDERSVAIDVTGTVHHDAVEGGGWVIAADGGPTYSGAELPAELQVEGARVVVQLEPLTDMVRVGPGLPCRILSARPVDCGGGCGVGGTSSPPLTLEIVDAVTGQAVPGFAISNVSLPGSTTSVSCVGTEASSRCSLDAGPGRYVLDVTAAGYAPSHVDTVVAARAPVPGDCCHRAFEPQVLTIRLVPTGAGGP